MREPAPATTFRRLPLSAEQDSEIRHYIHLRMRSGRPWDTLELRAMLTDMLTPPETEAEGTRSLASSMSTELQAAVLDDCADGADAADQ